MLEFMRRNANSWIMILIFGVIILVFAFNFGPWAGSQLSDVPYAAIVNNQAISMAEFRSAYANQMARIKQFRPDYSEEQADNDGLKMLIVEQLISRELLTQLGHEQKLKIGAKTLADEIKERVFGPEADFDKEEYSRRVQGYFQVNVAQFEEMVAKELVAEQMANLLGTAVNISDDEVKKQYLDKNTKASIEYVKVNPQFFVSDRVVSAQEALSFIERNPARISEYYNENQSYFNKDEQVRASHILIKSSSETNATDKEAQKKTAQGILDRIKAGEDFAKLAKEYSEDLGSKADGGDLNFFTKGMMVKEFSDAAFALKLGEISEIIESPFGFHIIKVTDKMEKTTTSLEAASNEIATKLILKDEQSTKAREYAQKALALMKTGLSISQISLPDLVNMNLANNNSAKATNNNPVADESADFNRASTFIQKLGKADQLVNQVFKLNLSDPVAKDVIEANGHFYAVRLKKLEEASLDKFEEEKDGIKAGLIYPRRRAFMQQYLSSLKQNAKITYNNALLGMDS